MTITRRQLIGRFAMGAAVLPLGACGTILYPERRGQQSGRIDPGVAVLNGVGLLLFLVPGVIAFAVDFSTGAIYLPGGRRADAEDGEELKTVSFDEPLTDEAMDRIWLEHVEDVRGFRNEDVIARPVASLEMLDQKLRIAARVHRETA